MSCGMIVLGQVLQREPECSRPEACSVLESVSAAVAGKPLCCPNHEGKVGILYSYYIYSANIHFKALLFFLDIHQLVITLKVKTFWRLVVIFSHLCPHLQVMEFYCESCETAMCLDCTEGEHREHVTVPLRDVVEQHKAALKTQLDAIHSRWGPILDRFMSNHVLRLKHSPQIWHLLL